MKMFKFYLGGNSPHEAYVLYSGNTLGEALSSLLKGCPERLLNLTRIEEVKEIKAEVWAGNARAR